MLARLPIPLGRRLLPALTVSLCLLHSSASWAISIQEEPPLDAPTASPSSVFIPLPQDNMTMGVYPQSLPAVAVMRKGLWRQALEMSAGVLAEKTPDVEALGVFTVAGAVLGDTYVVKTALPQLQSIKGEAYFGPLARGILALRNGRNQQALDEFNAVLAKHRDDPLALYFRGEIFNRKGNRSAALQDFQDALKSAPDFAPALVAAAHLLSVQEVPEKAIAMVERAVAIDPQRSEYRARLAELLDRAGQHERARKLYIELLQAMPGMGQTYLRRAWQLMQNGHDRQALELIDKTFSLYGPRPLGHLIRAMANIAPTNRAALDRHLSAYLTASGKSSDAHFGAGLCYLAAGIHNKARQHFRTVLEQQPTNLQAKTNLTVIAQLTGQNHMARTALAELDTDGEAAAVVDFIRANLKLAEGSYEAYRKLLFKTESLLLGAANLNLRTPALSPQQARALANDHSLLLILFLNQWHSQVIRYADHALGTVSTDPVALYFRGMALKAQGQLKEAEINLRATTNEEPDFFAAQIALASVLLDQGKKSDSLLILEKAKQAARSGQALFQLATLNERIGRSDRARELLQKALANSSTGRWQKQAKALLSQLDGRVQGVANSQ